MKNPLFFFATATLATAACLLLPACSVKKNTPAARFYHAFTARFNTFYNGQVAYDDALYALEHSYTENYTQPILLHPISASDKDKPTPGGPFDLTIEKCTKAIRLHSIQTKPPKKPGWRNDPKAVRLQNQQEYNPFLHHAWLSMGKANFFNADFLRAAATFSFIAKLYRNDHSVYAQARIWQARSYTELGWLFEAEDILQRLNNDPIPPSLQPDLALAQTAFHLANNDPSAAAVHLPRAIPAQPSKLQRTRLRYLLAQLYAAQGRNLEAFQLFRKVANANPPYPLEFAARIRQTEVFAGHNHLRMIKMLERMATSDKNKDFLDQLFYAAGNIHLNRLDTAAALTYFERAVDNSTLHGLDKALAQIRAGDIYFAQRDYVRAQPHFSGALQAINKQFHDYKRIAHLSAILDELAIHAKSVHLQDSLQNLARMPPEERLDVIDKLIEQVIKEEKLAQEQADKDAYLAEQDALGSGIDRKGTEVQTALGVAPSADGSFYFYNPQTVTQGKVQFQRKWGRRPLTDDWRRIKKSLAPAFNPNNNDNTADTAGGDTNLNPDPTSPNDSLPSDTNPDDSLATDPKSREFYLQQIPFTQDEVDASNLIILDGLYNLACLYNDKLEDLTLALQAFQELLLRFPDNEFRLNCLYRLFLLALRLSDDELALHYKQLLIHEFPDSPYAIAINDPDYFDNIRNMDAVQDSLYQISYFAHLNADFDAVRANFQLISLKYPLAKLRPKFMFLDALSYVAQGDYTLFQTKLDALLHDYPSADVSELAAEILKGILKGRELVQSDLRGMVWNIRFGLDASGALDDADANRTFSPDPNLPHSLVLLFPNDAFDRNQLLYAVAAYNFSNFIIKEFDLEFVDDGPATLLVISGFFSFDEALQYDKRIFASDGFANSLHRDVALFPISNDNFQTLIHGHTPDEYINFLELTFPELAADIVARWRLHLDSPN
jgi:tetratricopeptide (TPR) repeat protein